MFLLLSIRAILTQEEINDLPESIAQDLTELINEFKKDIPDIAAIAKTLGVPSLDIETIIQQLENSFHL